MRLAIAESRYNLALHKIETHYDEPNSAQSVVNDLRDHIMYLIDGGVHQKVWDDDPLKSVEFSMQVLELMIKAAGKEKRLHRRYLGEARAQRKKAFRA